MWSDQNLICPNCGRAIFMEFFSDAYETEEGGMNLLYGFCPSCREFMAKIEFGKEFCKLDHDEHAEKIYDSKIIYPLCQKGKILDEYIPEKYRDLYRQAEQVNNISPMASATLSRYVLQLLLHEEIGIHERNLEEEIKKLEDKTELPSEFVSLIQVMRKIANFGAHPKKSTNSSEITEVENGESEVMLEVIYELFDYIFVKPKKREEFLKNIEEKYGITTD